MTCVVLNLHGSEPVPTPGDLHTIADHEFVASMELAKCSLGRRGHERLRALAMRARDLAAG